MTGQRRYVCTEKDCGKAFFRSEHLSRHKLNHCPKQVFQCQRCPKKFVRKDLVQRHEKRHEKGMWFRNSGGVVNTAPGEASGLPSLPPPKTPGQASFTRNSPQGFESNTTLSTTDGDEDIRQEPQNVGMMQGMGEQMRVDADVGIGAGGGIGGQQRLHQQSNFQMHPNGPTSIGPPDMAGGMSIDGVSNSLFFDSSADILGQSNDIDWFFEGVPVEVSPLHTVDFNGPPTTHPSSIFIPSTSPFPSATHSGMPAHSSPHVVSPATTTTWSTVRSRLLSALYTLPPDVLESSFFYPTNLASFFELYFGNYHPHFPLFHRPTLLPAEAPPLLITAIVTLGATLTPDESHFRVSTRIHDALRWLVFGTGAFEPPAPLWCLQTLLILQAHEKMFSTRKHHEMAHIFHGSIITLMRRGTAYSGLTTPPDQPCTELEQTWHRWVANEASKRTAFFALIMDAQHTFMFGHTCVLSAHDVQLPLPCAEILWEQQTPEEWARLSQNTPEPPRFLPTLKGLLAKSPVPSTCSAFARFILLHGLFSVIANLHARDLATLGVGRSAIDDNISTPYAMDMWKDILERAIDTWSFSLLSREPSLSLEAAKPLHRMAHVAIYTNIVDFHILAGAPPLLGSPLSRHDYAKAESRVRAWSKGADSKKALYHCLLLVKETVFTGRRYLAVEDNIALRPWCLYHATLILWVYGQTIEDADNNNSSNTGRDIKGIPTSTHPIQQGSSSGSDGTGGGGSIGAEEYLVRMLMLLKSNTPGILEGANQTRGLILSVRESLENCRWELLQEAYVTLGRLIGIPGPDGVSWSIKS